MLLADLFITKGSCQPGQTAAQTGCVPLSGSGSRHAPAEPNNELPTQTFGLGKIVLGKITSAGGLAAASLPNNQKPKLRELEKAGLIEYRNGLWFRKEAKTKETVPPTEASVKAKTQLDEMLDFGVGLGIEVFVNAKDAKFRHPTKYVQALGKDFHGSPLPEGIAMGEPKQCYMNASLLLMRHPDWSYAEGFVTTPKVFLPILHGWCVTADGKVVDNTLDDPQDAAYKGVVYDRKKYLKYVQKKKFYGVLGGNDKDAAKVLAKGGPW